MPKDAPPPIHLPDRVWNDPAVLHLCRARDANGLFRLAKKYGTSNERIAYWTGTDAAEASRRVNGKAGQVTALHRWQHIADGLNMPDHARIALGLSARSQSLQAQPEPSEPPPALSDDDLVVRLDNARRGVGAMIDPASTSTDIERLEAAVEQAARDALSVAPASMLAVLLADFEAAHDCVRSNPTQRSRRRAVRVAASTATLIGEELMVLGKVPQSSQWFTAADQLASAAEDIIVRSRAATLQARLPLYFGEVAESVELARRAQEIAPAAATFPGSLGSMVEALALAQLGDADSSREALDVSRHAFDSQRDGSADETVFTFSRRRFLFYESRVLLDTGALADAWNAQDHALALYPSADNGDVTVLQLDRARLLVRRGEVADGCAHAVQTLTAIPAEQQAPLYVNRGWRVLAAVPRADRRASSAADLREALTTLGRVG